MNGCSFSWLIFCFCSSAGPSGSVLNQNRSELNQNLFFSSNHTRDLILWSSSLFVVSKELSLLNWKDEFYWTYFPFGSIFCPSQVKTPLSFLEGTSAVSTEADCSLVSVKTRRSVWSLCSSWTLTDLSWDPACALSCRRFPLLWTLRWNEQKQELLNRTDPNQSRKPLFIWAESPSPGYTEERGVCLEVLPHQASARRWRHTNTPQIAAVRSAPSWRFRPARTPVPNMQGR